MRPPNVTDSSWGWLLPGSSVLIWDEQVGLGGGILQPLHSALGMTSRSSSWFPMRRFNLICQNLHSVKSVGLIFISVSSWKTQPPFHPESWTRWHYSTALRFSTTSSLWCQTLTYSYSLWKWLCEEIKNVPWQRAWASSTGTPSFLGLSLSREPG